MLYIKKVMTRKDAYSVLLAIIIASLVNSPLFYWTQDIGSRLIKSTYNPESGASFASPLEKASTNEIYWRPLLTLFVGLLIIEASLRLLYFLNDQFSSSKKR